MANKSVGHLLGDGAWVAGSILTNPADGTVLADTGPLSKGNYLFAVSWSGTAAAVYDVQHRDSANGSNIKSQRRRPAAGNDDWLLPNKIAIDTNERVRCALVGAYIGETQCSIMYAEVG